jgi:hypothetical protein
MRQSFKRSSAHVNYFVFRHSDYDQAAYVTSSKSRRPTISICNGLPRSMRPILSLQIEDETVETYGERTIHIADHGILFNVHAVRAPEVCRCACDGHGNVRDRTHIWASQGVGLNSSGVGIFVVVTRGYQGQQSIIQNTHVATASLDDWVNMTKIVFRQFNRNSGF